MPPTRHTITIGGITKPELLDRLRQAHIELNPIGLELFAADWFQTLDTPRLVETIQTTPAEIGLTRGGALSEVTHAAAGHGLTLCALELGPHLRLALLDQPEGARGRESTAHQAPPGSITVLSPPRDGGGGGGGGGGGEERRSELWGFYLRRIDGALWLRGFRASTDHVWQPDDMLVFTAAQSIDVPARPSRVELRHPEIH